MRLNIFNVPDEQISGLRKKLEASGLSLVNSQELDDWSAAFYFSADPKPTVIPWVEDFRSLLGAGEYHNQSYSGAYLFSKRVKHYVISFGKAHFYIRPYCNYDFGVELAKRIADEADVKQTASKRFQGRQRKGIRSFKDNNPLDLPAGESVDFIQAALMADKHRRFGKTAKFGTSALLEPDVQPDSLGKFITAVDEALVAEERFKVPRTIVLTEAEEVERYDTQLQEELLRPVGTSDLTTNTFDLFGVDFVFGSSGSYELRCGHYKARAVDRLTMASVKDYINAKGIPSDKALNLKIVHHLESGASYSTPIKEAVDFIADEDRVVLSGGKWLRFNQDYLDFLDDSIRDIEVEDTEPEYATIRVREDAFNDMVAASGAYELADRDFSVLQTTSSTPIEAWDLRRGDTVYAVKFGTPQKLNYVCDQAHGVLDLLHNRANTKQVPNFSRYCLWMGYRAKTLPSSLADTGSIILKQKIDAWARRCRELEITPVLKLSLRSHIPGGSESADAPSDG